MVLEKIKNIKNLCPKFRETPREAITKNKHGEDTHYIFLEYLCEFESGDPKPADDIAELQWVAKENLKDTSVTAPSIKMYKELGWI